MTQPFWNKKYGKNAICAITLTRLRPGKNKEGIPYTITTPCGHTFYRSAFNNWLNDHNTCPVCRKNLKNNI